MVILKLMHVCVVCCVILRLVVSSVVCYFAPGCLYVFHPICVRLHMVCCGVHLVSVASYGRCVVI